MPRRFVRSGIVSGCCDCFRRLRCCALFRSRLALLVVAMASSRGLLLAEAQPCWRRRAFAGFVAAVPLAVRSLAAALFAEWVPAFSWSVRIEQGRFDHCLALPCLHRTERSL